MTEDSGRFVWHELMTKNAAAATKFYPSLFGWSVRDAGNPSMKYTIVGVGENGVGGIFELTEPMCSSLGTNGSWIGYIAVDEVDQAADRAARLGGKITVPPTDIPNVGRFAIAADPQGGPFVLFRPSASGPAHPLPPGTAGTYGWNELMTTDWPRAWAFYSELFGWRKKEAVDMGPLGTYQTFGGETDAFGGMMNDPNGAPGARWQYYVNVDSMEETLARVKAGGGKLIHGPHPVPGGSLIANCLDPEGLSFALVQPKGR